VPFEEQDGGIVCEAMLLVVEDGVHETAQDFEGRFSSGGSAQDEVDESLFPESLAV
jgi:hypothetical protein